MTPKDILKNHSESVQKLTQDLRAFIKKTIPNLTESTYPGWHGIGFKHKDAGYICGIFPRDDSVRLLFEKGVSLFDPYGILKGDGKRTRYIEIYDAISIPYRQIKYLLLNALEL